MSVLSNFKIFDSACCVCGAEDQPLYGADGYCSTCFDKVKKEHEQHCWSLDSYYDGYVALTYENLTLTILWCTVWDRDYLAANLLCNGEVICNNNDKNGVSIDIDEIVHFINWVEDQRLFNPYVETRINELIKS